MPLKVCADSQRVFWTAFTIPAMFIFSFSLTQEPLLGKQAEGSDVRGTGAPHAAPNMQVYK